jgi:hypothetical protein
MAQSTPRRKTWRACGRAGNPNLGDVRGALNAFTNIVVGQGTGPNLWHWCTRDNPQLTQRFAPDPLLRGRFRRQTRVQSKVGEIRLMARSPGRIEIDQPTGQRNGAKDN